MALAVSIVEHAGKKAPTAAESQMTSYDGYHGVRLRNGDLQVGWMGPTHSTYTTIGASQMVLRDANGQLIRDANGEPLEASSNRTTQKERLRSMREMRSYLDTVKIQMEGKMTPSMVSLVASPHTNSGPSLAQSTAQSPASLRQSQSQSRAGMDLATSQQSKQEMDEESLSLASLHVSAMIKSNVFKIKKSNGTATAPAKSNNTADDSVAASPSSSPAK